MRVIDGEMEQNNFDVPLLLSLNVSRACCFHTEYWLTTGLKAIASTLHARVGALELKDAVDGQQADWSDWIFHESGRRSVTHHNGRDLPLIDPQLRDCYPDHEYAL
jgi:hypothetical protein